MSIIVHELRSKTCRPCEGEDCGRLNEAEVRAYLDVLDGWEHGEGGIRKSYRFEGYRETIGFVNALAWIVHREQHHPDLEVRFKSCTVFFTTYALGGLSENDFICAAKVDALLEQRG